MPLPPIPGAAFLRFRADAWRKQQQTHLDALREQASAWDLEAQRAVHGIGDTFSSLGSSAQQVLPDLPSPPPLPEPVQGLGAAVGGAFSDLGSGIQSGVQGAREAIQAVAPPAPDWSQQAQAAVDSISGATGGGLDALTNPDTYGRAAGIAPLPPGLEGIRPGLQAATQNAAQAVDTLATDPDAVAAATRTINRFTPTGMIGSLAGQIRDQTTPQQLGREVVQGLPALGALGTLAPTPGAIAGNVMSSVAQQGALGLGLPEGVAGGVGLLADVLTPDPGDAARVAARTPGVVEDLASSAPRFGERVGSALTSTLDNAGAALDDAVLGIRRGQRGLRVPKLSPEQAAQRAADGAAEQRVFDAIQRLWRQGPEGEALADDLRFLAVGKGEEGEAAARSLLTRKGLGDLLPPGVIPDATTPAEGLLGAATRATDPLLARGALTGGERAFDLASGTAGGVLGAATADEDATWQERAGRGVLGASLGALAGANARQLGRLGDAGGFGAAAGKAPQPEGRSLAGLTATDIPELLSAIPLAAPTSLLANLTGGSARTLERVLGKVFEGRPVEAVADLGAMVREVPGAVRGLRGNFRMGPTAENPGMTGEAIAQGLTARSGVPGALASGTKANAATDAFWRQLNEAGAGGAAAYRRARGEAVPDAVEAALRASAGDFATFAGPNSRVAQGLTKYKRTIHDPDAPFADKAMAWGITSMAPYVMMPERLLRATVGALLPVESAVGATRAFLKGDRAAAREMAGRATAGMVATGLLTKMYLDGAITGDAPADQAERKRREALGEQWNTIQLPGGARVSTRFFGSVGMQANAVATTLDAARKAQEKGADPGAVLEQGVNGAAKWFLDASYLSDLQDFTEQWGKGNFMGGVRSVAAGIPSRFTSPVTGAINAFDPYERDPQTFPEKVANRTGLRAVVPVRIDPTTGEAQRRSGNPLTRYLGESGAEETPENTELARHGLTPRTFQDGKYASEQQTLDAVRTLKQAYGAETGRAVRDVQKTPEYQKGDDAQKKKLLERALRDADFEAELRVGDGVKRSAKAQAAWEYSATAKYQGVPKDADANTIRRYNRSVSQARAAKAEARKADPKNPDKAEAAWARAHPEEAKLARRASVDATVLRKKKAAIYDKHGVKP